MEMMPAVHWKHSKGLWDCQKLMMQKQDHLQHNNSIVEIGSKISEGAGVWKKMV